MDHGSRMNSASKFSPSSERKTASDNNMTSSTSNLREEHEEKQRLEKSNFDLKMKVYYLEENLKRYQDGEHAGDAQSEHQRLEIGKLKLQLEDKQVDLEQRNLLLIKSKNAIEALKVEIERLRNENNHQQDLEDRIRRLKQLNEDIENDYRAQISQLEQQLAAARQSADTKEIEKATCEDKVSHLEISFEQIDNHLKDTQQEKNRLHDQLTAAQHKIQLLEDEGTQNRAHIDLYRIQMEEAMQERDSFKEKLRQEQLAKLKVDEDGKLRLSDCTKHYESQIRTMRINHEQDLEKIRAGHMEMLADVRENYQAELGRAKQDLERALGEVRSADAQDLNRVKENFAVRIEEKNEEIKSLRGMMNADSQRVDALLHELDATRLQLREKSQLSEKLLVETAAKTEELKVLPRIMKDLEECRDNFASLQKQLQQEQHQKVLFSSQVDQLTNSLDTARADLSQREHSLKTALADIARLTRDVSDLSVKADSIEHVSRDNERLKGLVARLETDNLGLTHKVSELTRELERTEEEVSKVLADRDSLKDAIRAVQAKLDGAIDHNDSVQVQIQSERERRSATDAALAETRSVLAQCREELQSERNVKLSCERRVQQCEEEMREMRGSLGQACVLSFNAMQEWDDTLSMVLDGELFTGFMRGSASANNGSTTLRQMASPGRGGYSRSSPSRGAVHENYEVEQLLAMPTDQLMQRVAVRVERVGIKLQRTEKIRGLFVAQAEKLVDIVQQTMQNSQERITLYHHKLVDAQNELQKLRATVERDRKQREIESEELSQFKEVVRSQHTAQLRDSEIRFAQVTQQLEHEKSRSDELQRQVATQADELRSLQQINHRMNEDLQVMERTEQIVADLTSRVGSLGELNRNMSKDIDAKADTIAQLTHDNGELKMELSSIVARCESLLQQVRSRDEAIEASEAKLQGFIREIERLRTRQIHPDLAKTILDTQSILQTAVRNDTPTALPVSAIAPVYSQSSSMGDRVGEYLNRVDQLEAAAANLIQRTSEMLASFEAHMGSSRSTMTRGAAAVSAIKQELYELLDANSTLAVQMQQLVAEFKKSIRQLNLSLSAHEQPKELAQGSMHSSSSNHRTPVSPVAPSSVRKIDDSPASKFGTLSLHSPMRLEGVIEPQYSSSIRGHASAMTTTQRIGEYSSASKEPQSPDAYRSQVKSARFHSSPTVGATASDYSRSSFDLPSRIGGYQPSASLSASMAAYTPNTASRLSTNRLNKLGSDLEALARKLDSYDTSRSK